ncbi:MAG: hypothetical protein V4632_07135 [Pseudomonadota bacterium]
MTIDYRAGWPLPDEFLIELGRLSALWASLESLLNTLIGKLAGFDSLADTTPFILVVHSSFPQRLDMLGALCEELKGSCPHLANHKEVVGKLRSAQTSRNRFAHNGVAYDPDKDQYMLPQGSARGKVKVSVEPVTVEDVHAVSKEIHEAQLALYKLVLKREVKPVWSKNDEAAG